MAMLNGFQIEAWGSSAIGSYLVPGTPGVKLTVRKELAPILIGFAADFHRLVEPLHVGWCWGFNPKKIEGSDTWSHHAYGGAIDLNAPAHAMGKRNTFGTKDRATIREILLPKYTYRGVRLLRWGGDFRTRPDDMHVETIAPRAILLAAAQALQAPRKPVPAKPGGKAPVVTPGSRQLEVGSKGADVAYLQRWLGLHDDGIFGPNTKAKVIAYQRMKGLTADGIVGPKTWRAMRVIT